MVQAIFASGCGEERAVFLHFVAKVVSVFLRKCFQPLKIIFPNIQLKLAPTGIALQALTFEEMQTYAVSTKHKDSMAYLYSLPAQLPELRMEQRAFVPLLHFLQNRSHLLSHQIFPHSKM